MADEVFRYPLRIVRDPESVLVHIRDATNRIIADKMIGRDAKEIVDILNERAGYVPNPLYVDEHGNG
jgi:hypothetical protein